MIYINQNNEKQMIAPTVFPDGTSQVWQLDLAQYKNEPVVVGWYFEQEAELIWVNQLITLLSNEGIEISELFIPYLPYGRQDKAVSNDTTFAKSVFLNMLMMDKVGKLTTVDAHSDDAAINSLSPALYISKAIEQFKPEVLVFPDASAYLRYQKVVEDTALNRMVLDKKRNQETGRITALKIDESNTSKALLTVTKRKQKMLIIDDICDGGATFMRAATYIHSRYQAELGLYVTHGIFSKGYEPLIEAGITTFFTTKSLINNINGFDLEEKQS